MTVLWTIVFAVTWISTAVLAVILSAPQVILAPIVASIAYCITISIKKDY